MAERLDRALDLLERLVAAAERIADRDIKPAKLAPTTKPARSARTREELHGHVREKLRRAGAVDR